MKINIRLKITSGYIFVIFLIIILSYIIIMNSEKTLFETVGNNSVDFSDTILHNINDTINRKLENIIVLFSNDLDTFNTIDAKNFTGSHTYIDMQHKITNLLDFLEKKHPYLLLHELIILNARNEVIITYTDEHITKSAPSDHPDNAPFDDQVYTIHYDEDHKDFIITIKKKIYSGHSHLSGIFIVKYSILQILKEIEILFSKKETMNLKIITHEGRLIYSSKPYQFLKDISTENYYLNLLENKNYFTVTEGGRDVFYAAGHSHSNSLLNWTVLVSHNVDELLYSSRQLKILTIILSSIIIIISLIFALIVSRSISKPIIELKNNVIQIGEGNLDTSIIIRSNDEIGELADNFNQMVVLRKKAEEALIVARDEAQKANKAKSEFLANMSHELRTPLNAVLGFSELLYSMMENDSLKHYVNSIKIAGKSLFTLINDILDLSKIEAGMLDIEKHPVNLTELINEIKQIFDAKIIEKKLKFIIEIDENLPPYLILDEIRLRQVLLNLTGNALKFTHKGYIKLSVTVKEIKKNEIDLTIAVADTGIGIGKNDFEKIFKAFKQQSGAINKHYGGTGLGLTISKKLVTMMSGTITLESEIDEGSIFTINLTNVQISTNENINVIKQQLNYETITFNPTKLLIVDDIESNRTFIKQFLINAGIEVLEAENGQEAIIIAEETQPNLILMDIRMPIMDGFDAINSLKENKTTARIPVIALTASSKKDDIDRFSESGFSDYIFKPVEIPDLFTKLMRFLPYMTTEKQSVTAAGSSEETAHSFIIDNIPDKTEFTHEINTTIIPLLNSFDGVIKIQEAKDFAGKLSIIGKRYNVEYLITQADVLNKYIKKFNIIMIKKTIKQIINNLSKITGGTV